ncbi:MAG TPA: hypothetical protein PKC84_00240 [Paracoccaceae bacterium]|nr:hypothetical protein [Paracoccaceae bacterium]
MNRVTDRSRLLRRLALGLGALAAAAAALWWWRLPPRPLDRAAAGALYAAPLPPPAGPLAVFHLGHSLVGPDMPAMLEALAPPGHSHAAQIGWGTTLRAHWQHPDPPLPGFETAGLAPRFAHAGPAIDAGGHDALVLTEMVELRAALRWHDSPAYLARWAARARAARPDIRIYLYETWHPLDDPAGWLERLDADLPALWEGELLFGALARDPARRPIHLIPAGQVMAALVRRIEGGGAVPGLARREDLFARTAEGTQDTIHMSEAGAYLVALTHYAVLYQRDPRGLPARLALAGRGGDGTAGAPSPEAAQLMQEVVWDVVRRLPRTGVPPG